MSSVRPEVILQDFEPLGRAPMSERVAWRILELVRSGNLRAGDRLPTENEFAQAMGVSRPVIREALRGLSMLGVVESRQGGRCYVTDLSPARLMAPVQLALPVDEANLEILYEARSVVEGQLVALAATRASAEESQTLVRLAKSGFDVAHDPIAFRLHDFEFHSSLMALAANAYLERSAQSFYNLGMDYRREATEAQGVPFRSVEQHITIADAVCRRDEAGASAAMREHLRSITETTAAVIERRAHGRDG